MCRRDTCYGLLSVYAVLPYMRYVLPTLWFAHMQLFNILAIIGLIPVYDRVFVPLVARFGKKLTLLQRIGAWHCWLLLPHTSVMPIAHYTRTSWQRRCMMITSKRDEP